MKNRNFATSLRKAELGEAIVQQFLEGKGFVVYRPATEGQHWIDMLAVQGKEKAIAIDVKAKARMNRRPETGINRTAYNEYVAFGKKYGIPFFLIFVDDMIGEIYGNLLHVLDLPHTEGGVAYPREARTKEGTLIRYWPLSRMRRLGKLKEAELAALRKQSQRGYEYAPSKNE